ncbi:hypothetical protein [Lactococcus garvieae]|uniref:hypothetical protein n=1 Tax=Lactococcus garvieae TaxID=1363 RepID=UPI0023ED4046|nr:hypothetical protein [Lactococcus garvieae]
MSTLDKYFTKLSYLSTIEDVLMQFHKISRSALDEEDFYSEFGTSKEFYEENEDYRKLVDDLEKFRKKVEPELVEMLLRVLKLREKYVGEKINQDKI